MEKYGEIVIFLFNIYKGINENVVSCEIRKLVCGIVNDKR